MEFSPLRIEPQSRAAQSQSQEFSISCWIFKYLSIPITRQISRRLKQSMFVGTEQINSWFCAVIKARRLRRWWCVLSTWKRVKNNKEKKSMWPLVKRISFLSQGAWHTLPYCMAGRAKCWTRERTHPSNWLPINFIHRICPSSIIRRDWSVFVASERDEHANDTRAKTNQFSSSTLSRLPHKSISSQFSLESS